MYKVITTGKFDLLHAGHFNILNFCRTLAGRAGEVIVLLDSDSRIACRDCNFPVLPYVDREKHILMLKCFTFKMVDQVIAIYSDEQLSDTIMNAEADFLVKGSEWNGKKVIGAEFTNLVFYNTIPIGEEKKISSSDIRDRISTNG